MTRATDEDVVMLRAHPESIYDFVNSGEVSEAGRTLDLDKQWHAIHFLLTGSAVDVNSPLSILPGRFEEVGPDNGYGPAWFVPKEALRSFHQALSSRTDAEWARRYDPPAAVAENVYIADTLLDEGEEAIGFLQDDIARLRAFFAAAVAADDNAFALIT